MKWFRSVCEEAGVNLKFCFQVKFRSIRTGSESVGNESREIARFFRNDIPVNFQYAIWRLYVGK